MSNITPSKARPPLGTLGPLQAQLDKQGLLQAWARVQFDPRNGGPLLAMWLPVQRSQETWAYLPAKDAPPLPFPQPDQIDVSGLQPVDQATDDWVDLPPLTWPTHAQWAMLVLLHDQSRDTGAPFIDTDSSLMSLTDDAAANATAVDPAALTQTIRQAIADLIVDLHKGEVRLNPNQAVFERPVPKAVPSNDARGKAPDNANTPFTLALASCAYPSQVFDVSASGEVRTDDLSKLLGPADQALYRLSQRFRAGGTDAPSLCVLTGDQVYADATAGLFDPGFLDDALSFAYQRVDDSPGWKQLRGASGPAYALFDDHELRDNWAPPANPPDELRRAVLKYWRRQRVPHWPGGVPLTPAEPFVLHADGVPQGHPVFLANTRTERQAARTPATLRTAHIMGDVQWAELQAWIGAHGRQGDPPHFIVSSSMVLPRRLAEVNEPERAVYNDTWVGHPASLHRLLHTLCLAQASNIVLLSGDEHMGLVAVIDIHHRCSGKRVRLLSVHAPALYAPYPFANSRTDLFPASDPFTLSDPDGQDELDITVQTWCPPNADGYALVQTHQAGADWAVSVHYELNDGLVHHWPALPDGPFVLG